VPKTKVKTIAALQKTLASPDGFRHLEPEWGLYRAEPD